MWLRVKGWWSFYDYHRRNADRACELLVNTQHLVRIKRTERGEAVLDWGRGPDTGFFTEVPIDKLLLSLSWDEYCIDLRSCTEDNR